MLREVNGMPQMNKGGKFIFGMSFIRDNFEVHFPPQAINEYNICLEDKVYLFTGAKATGGFCVTRKGLLMPSKIGNILKDTPDLRDYKLPEGKFTDYKGRKYCWISISKDGIIELTDEMLQVLDISVGMELLSIRSSDIAFTMGAKGPLLEKAKKYKGIIEVY